MARQLRPDWFHGKARAIIHGQGPAAAANRQRIGAAEKEEHRVARQLSGLAFTEVFHNFLPQVKGWRRDEVRLLRGQLKSIFVGSNVPAAYSMLHSRHLNGEAFIRLLSKEREKLVSFWRERGKTITEEDMSLISVDYLGFMQRAHNFIESAKHDK
ncbi:MAG: hypothetical protein HY544_05065 [Candidatus Diapherotrites archaeon]|uniref:Uncharacterized protein n=1 Tax=Candidatus Iainarchaeum sp. TaxID=3101447 RepID=A0A8T3YPB2_9ARCH|nr:hypothetical protein [Candidatus Diapherotrites archaeon]